MNILDRLHWDNENVLSSCNTSWYFIWVFHGHFLIMAWAQVWDPVPEGSIKIVSLSVPSCRTVCVTPAICWPGGQQLTEIIDRNQHIWTRARLCEMWAGGNDWWSATLVTPQGAQNKVSGHLVSGGRDYSHRAQPLTEEKYREAWSFLLVKEYLCFGLFILWLHFLFFVLSSLWKYTFVL